MQQLTTRYVHNGEKGFGGQSTAVSDLVRAYICSVLEEWADIWVWEYHYQHLGDMKFIIM